MKKTFDVHVYAVVRVKVSGVQAEDQQSAITTALNAVDYYSLFSAVPNSQGVQTEFAEDFSDYLVDVVDDEDYLHSRSYRDSHHLKALRLTCDAMYGQ